MEEEQPKYYPEHVQPSDMLQRAMSYSLSEQEQKLYQDLQSIEAGFGKVEPEFSVRRHHKKIRKIVKTFDEIEDENLPIERSSSFFDTSDAVKIGPNIFVRKYFVAQKNQFFVFFMKKNFLTQDSSVDNTFLSVSSFELPNLIEKLSILIWEIDQTPFRKLVQRLANSQDALIDDHLNPKFWSPEFTLAIDSNTLHLRQFREKNGTYMIKYWSPRKASNSFKWCGPSMSMPLGLAKEFLNLLKIYTEEIDNFEANKLQQASTD